MTDGLRIHKRWNHPSFYGPWAFVGSKDQVSWGFGGKVYLVPHPNGLQAGISVLIGRWNAVLGITTRIVVTKPKSRRYRG